MPEEVRRHDATPADKNLAQVVLDAHGEDAFRTMIDDVAFLDDQLKTASMLIAADIVRVWRPKFEQET